MTRIGTSYFVSIDKAASYYRDYEGTDGFKAAWRKIEAGEIHIGKPTIAPGEHLEVIDEGKRYAIWSPDQ